MNPLEKIIEYSKIQNTRPNRNSRSEALKRAQAKYYAANREKINQIRRESEKKIDPELLRLKRRQWLRRWRKKKSEETLGRLSAGEAGQKTRGRDSDGRGSVGEADPKTREADPKTREAGQKTLKQPVS